MEPHLQKAHLEEINIRQQFIYKLLKVSSLIKRERENIVGKFGISFSKFNILEVLLNVTPNGLSQTELREYLIDKTLDVPRLIQQLDKDCLVENKRKKTNKKQAHITITPKGIEVLKQIALHSSVMNKGTLDLTDAEVQQMLPKLEKMIAAFIEDSDEPED
jgi:DNA-binding MarR family transcriptional regulator